MGDEKKTIAHLPTLYSETSRLYNGSIGLLATILFAWIGFLGFLLNLKWNSIPNNYLIVLMFSGFIVFGCSVLFFFVRMLRLGRFVTKIQNDLGLRDYINDLPSLSIFGIQLTSIDNVTRRSEDDPDKWSKAEIIASIILFLFFTITAYLEITFIVP